MDAYNLGEILKHFFEISGMDIAIVSTKNRIIARKYSQVPFCSCIHKSEKCLEMCEKSDTYHLNRAMETGRLEVYRCPFGLHEAIMPIRKNEEVVAFLFLGMGMEDTEEGRTTPYEKATETAPSLNKKAVLKSIDGVPAFSHEKLESFAAMLPFLASYIEANNLLPDSEMTIGQLTKGYIKENLDKKITLSDISWHLHCSTVTITEHFKREYGITVMEYVMHKRMRKAEQLLYNSELPIKDISEACGFPNMEYFSRSFKSVHGMSPRAWRQEKLNGEQ
jgi:AraC-like DNA-binding protein